MIRLAVEYRFNSCTEIVLNGAGRPVSVNRSETVVFLHGFEFFLDQPLIFDEALVHVRGPVHIHPGFPIVERCMLPQVSFDENFGTHRQIKDGVGNEGDAVDVAYPGALDAPDDGSRHERVDVAVGQDDEAGAQRRDDAVFELIGEIGRVEETEGARSEDVPAHGLLEFAADEHGSFQTDVRGRIAPPFKPVFEHLDLCGAS
jgi:hypothetical protein